MAIKKSAIAVELGGRGGAKTLKKYGRKQLKEWGAKGGRPRKKAVDNSPL